MELQLIRKKNTISNINFYKFRQAPQDLQHNKIYTRPSQIYQFMDDSSRPKYREASIKIIEDKIFNTSSKNLMSIQQCWKNDNDCNKGYMEFYKQHHKFIKPNGENTHYLQLLSKNYHLIRRQNHKKQNRPQRYFRKALYKTKTFKNSKKCLIESLNDQLQQQKNKQSTLKMNNFFQKTINTKYKLAHLLLTKERSKQQQTIGLKNALNRIRASEQIYVEMGSRKKQLNYDFY